MTPAATSDRPAECTVFRHPIGLAATTQLAPEAYRAQMMALYFFFSVGLGTSMWGVVAGYYDPSNEFAHFGILGVVAIVAGVVVFGISGWIGRLMEGVHQRGGQERSDPGMSISRIGRVVICRTPISARCRVMTGTRSFAVASDKTMRSGRRRRGAADTSRPLPSRTPGHTPCAKGVPCHRHY
jgi:hypothetical protein